MLGLQLHRAREAQPFKFKGLPPRDSSNMRILIKESPEQLDQRLGIKVRFDDSGTNPFSPAANAAAAIAVEKRVNDLKKALTDNGVDPVTAESQANQMLDQVSFEVRDMVLANRESKKNIDNVQIESIKEREESKTAIIDRLNDIIGSVNAGFKLPPPERPSDAPATPQELPPVASEIVAPSNPKTFGSFNWDVLKQKPPSEAFAAVGKTTAKFQDKLLLDMTNKEISEKVDKYKADGFLTSDPKRGSLGIHQSTPKNVSKEIKKDLLSTPTGVQSKLPKESGSAAKKLDMSAAMIEPSTSRRSAAAAISTTRPSFVTFREKY